MLIVADENIPYLNQAFSSFGEIVTMPGRSVSRDGLKDAEILLVRSVTPVGPELLDDTHVRFVGTATIGTDHMDTDYLNESGIIWAAAPGSNAASVADYVTSALLELERRGGPRLEGLAAAVIGCGNVGILIPMNQQRGWVIRRDVADRAESIKPSRVVVWVVSGDFLWPEALLAAVDVEAVSRFKRTSLKGSPRDCRTANRLVCLLSRHRGFLAVERIRAAVPLPGNVAIPVE